MVGRFPIRSEPSSTPSSRFGDASGFRPGATVRIAFWTVVASSRSDVLDLVDKHHDANAFERAATLAWTQAQVQLSHLGVDADEAALFQRLAGHVLYADSSMRPSSDAIRRGGGKQSGLWPQGISGDIPIVLVRIDDIEDIAIVGQLLRAHEYWRMKQLAVDLVILNERAASYVQDLQTALETIGPTSHSRPQVGGAPARGSVFVLRTDLLAAETRALLPSVARVVLVGRRREPVRPDQPSPGAETRRGTAGETHVARQRIECHLAIPESPPDLEFFNGLGGFAEDGREYVTILGAGQTTPAPWINVIANPSFGFQVVRRGRRLHMVAQ